MSYVLNQLTKEELLSFFGSEEQLIFRYFMLKSLFSQPELSVNQGSLPIQIPKEHIEQWVVQALGVESIGAGSYPIDVMSSQDRWGADIKMLSAKINVDGTLKENQESGETSLAQKFRDTGSGLDQLFLNGEYESIKNQWLEIYDRKYQKVFEERDVDDIYYFFIIRAGASFYLLGMKVDFNNLSQVQVKSNSNRRQAVELVNYIDNKLGSTRIYKAKKRLELRLYPAEWENRGNFIKFTTDFNVESVNLRDIIVDETSMNQHIQELAKKIGKTKVTIE